MTLSDAAIALMTGLVAGAFSGLLGVGGGVLMVPAMVVLLGQDQHVAAGTSLLVIVPTALVGSLANHRRGFLDRPVATRLGAGGLVGAVGGSLLALYVFGDVALRRLFGVFMLLVAARILTLPRRAPADPDPGAPLG